MNERSKGWTKLFRWGSDDVGEDFLATLMNALASVFEGTGEEERTRQIRRELTRAFGCEDISIFVDDPHERPSVDEGDWVLTVKSGFGEGMRVSQKDAEGHPDLVPGHTAPFSEDLARDAASKAVALAFRDEAFYGADIEKHKIVLLKDPSPQDDLGSGDLSVLAVPLHYTQHQGRIVERARVGVLVLFRVPNREDIEDVEKALGKLLACALVTPQCTLKDPVTGLYNERHLQNEIDRYMSLHQLTKGKIAGGLVVGMVDALRLYKQTLEAEGNVAPEDVGRTVSEALRVVGACLRERAERHDLGPVTYKAGLPARLGHDAFAVLLPLLQPPDMIQWARQTAKDVIRRDFPGEAQLATGELTISLRIIPLGGKRARSPEETMLTALEALDTLDKEQNRARRKPEELKQVVNTIRILKQGEWVEPRSFNRLEG